MKDYLPLKLGIFVALLFSAVIAACLLWRPLHIRYYLGKLHSADPKIRLKGVGGLLILGKKGHEILAKELEGGIDAADFLAMHWAHANEPVSGNEDGHYPLHLAIDKGYRDVVKLLIAKGVDADSKEEHDFTPLHLAVRHGRKNIITLLLSKGADINAKGGGKGMGITPLISAIRGNQNEITELLISEGADVNIGTDANQTPLHLAVDRGNKDLVSLLINKGADLNSKACDSRTPLHYAARYGRTAIAKILLSNGPDINVVGDGHWPVPGGGPYFGGVPLVTPLEFAVEHGHIKTARLLLDHGAMTAEALSKKPE